MTIYVCSASRGTPPYTGGKIANNLRKTADYCWEIAEAGHTPVAPHLYFSGFLDDMNPRHRARGMEMGAELIAICDEMWVFGKEQSEGMKRDIAKAEELGIPVIYK